MPASAGARRARPQAPRRPTRRPAAATGRSRPGSSPRPSRCCRCRRGCAGRAARRRRRASGRRARRRRRKRRSSNSSASTSGPSAARRRSKRVRESVISSSTGPSNCTTSCSSVRITSQARRADAAPALAAPVDAPLPGHAQVRVQRQVALEADEQVLAVRVHRAHGAPVEPLGPAVHRVAGLRRLDRHDRLADQRGAHAACGGRIVSPSGMPQNLGARPGRAGRARSEYISGSRGRPAGMRRTTSPACARGRASAGTACGRARAGTRCRGPAAMTAETTSPSGCSHSSVRLCTVSRARGPRRCPGRRTRAARVGSSRARPCRSSSAKTSANGWNSTQVEESARRDQRSDDLAPSGSMSGSQLSAPRPV